jgi:hypothetical protein
MPRRRSQQYVVINDVSEIPSFQNEDEEHEFWSTHEMSEELWDKLPPVPDDELPPVRITTNPLSVRFPADTVRRLKTLANRKGTGYQTLLKEFVIERLYEEERREGIISEADRPPARPRRRAAGKKTA